VTVAGLPLACTCNSAAVVLVLVLAGAVLAVVAIGGRRR
jgi:hypothetical protein